MQTTTIINAVFSSYPGAVDTAEQGSRMLQYAWNYITGQLQYFTQLGAKRTATKWLECARFFEQRYPGRYVP